MQVFLVNPSDVSFGIAVITPRWLFVLAAATPDEVRRRRSSSTKRSSARPVADQARRHRRRSASTPATRCAATKSGTPARAAGATVIYGGIHATLFPEEVRGARQRATPSSAATAISIWGTVLDDAADGHAAAAVRRRPRAPATRSCRRAGICCRRAATCGRPCRPCAAARSTARSARCGAPTARSRACATSTPCSTRSSSCAAAASASSRSPTTTSIRSR